MATMSWPDESLQYEICLKTCRSSRWRQWEIRAANWRISRDAKQRRWHSTGEMSSRLDPALQSHYSVLIGSGVYCVARALEHFSVLRGDLRTFHLWFCSRFADDARQVHWQDARGMKSACMVGCKFEIISFLWFDYFLFMAQESFHTNIYCTVIMTLSQTYANTVID